MESFGVLAEVAVGVAGFGTIASILGRDASRGSEEFFRTAALFLSSFGALFLCLVPLGLDTTDLPAESVWRLSSLAVAAFVTAFAIIMPRLRREHLDRGLWFGPVLYPTIAAVTLFNGAAQVANLSGLLAPPGPACVFFGVVWFLMYSCLILTRIVFIPPRKRSDPGDGGNGDRDDR